MAVQVYCLQADVEAIWPAADLLASVDDDASGTLSATELGHVARAIERGANFLNARLEMRYALADLAENAWCRDANAALAAYWLATRRGAAAPAQLEQQYDAYVAAAEAIAAGRMKVPQQVESVVMEPGVMNFEVRMGEGRAVRRV